MCLCRCLQIEGLWISYLYIDIDADADGDADVVGYLVSLRILAHVLLMLVRKHECSRINQALPVIGHKHGRTSLLFYCYTSYFPVLLLPVLSVLSVMCDVL